jgi:CRISPR/Cas system-associated exonuclease Cas4 (RecB family)
MMDIAKKVIEYKHSKIKEYPRHVNRASDAGHPCERYLVLCRTNWQDKTLISVETQFIFDGGNMIEELAIKELRDAGVEVIEQQRAFEWKEIELTGHIDGKVLIPDEGIFPLEIKGLAGYGGLEPDEKGYFHIQQFLKSSKSWVRKYAAQMTLYLMMDENEEEGIFYIKNKPTFYPISGRLRLDYDYAEQLVKKLERVNAHVKAGTLPDQIDDVEECQHCDFYHICLPEIRRDALEITTDPELQKQIDEWMALKPTVSEFKKLDDILKKKLTGTEKAIVGDYLITGKEIPRKGYTVEDTTYWQRKIVPLVQVQEGDD